MLSLSKHKASIQFATLRQAQDDNRNTSHSVMKWRNLSQLESQ